MTFNIAQTHLQKLFYFSFPPLSQLFYIFSSLPPPLSLYQQGKVHSANYARLFTFPLFRLKSEQKRDAIRRNILTMPATALHHTKSASV